MKFAFFIITVYVHYLILNVIKLFDSPYLILGTSLLIASIGFITYYFDKKKGIISDIGWGVLSGAITSLILIFGFLLFMVIALSG